MQMQETTHRAATEAEMREAKAPTPKSPEELATYVESLRAQGHCYGTCVYAMSLAATATFNYMASQLGVTGFQASCADLDILRRTRRMEHGFLILNAANLLYPQYDLARQTREWIAKTRPTLAPAAAKLIADADQFVSPKVLARWRKIAALDPSAHKEEP